MVKLSKGEVRRIGNEFIDFLEKEKLLKTYSKPELKQIYESRFRHRYRPGPSYSTLLFNLSRKNPRLRVKNGYVIFKNTQDWTNNAQTRHTTHPSSKMASERKKIFNLLKEAKAKDSFLKSAYVKIVCVPAELENIPGYFSCDLQTRQSFDVQIQNLSSEKLSIKKCLFLRDCPYMELTDEFQCTSLTESNEVSMPPNSRYDVTVMCTATNQVGSYCSDIFFRFVVPSSNRSEVVMRYIRFYKSDDVVEMLKPVAPFKREKNIVDDFHEVIPGVKIDLDASSNRLVFTRALSENSITVEVRRAFDRGLFRESEEEMKYGRSGKDAEMLELLSEELNFGNYEKKFRLLLHIEECQANVDILQYSLKDATVKKEGNKFVLKVLGLAERRPSVLREDKIYLQRCNPNDGMRWEGYVHQVRLDDVVLGLNRRFASMHVSGMKFKVHFTFNRLPIKLQHRAIECPRNEIMRQILFPSAVGHKKAPDQVKMFNKNIEQNHEQALAVRSIAHGDTRAPYIIYGPPGTGKTVTMVEAIKQVVIHHRKRVLICGPSNSSCDLLVHRLLEHVGKQEIFRMHAISRPWDDVPNDVKTVSNHGILKSDDYYFPNKETLQDYYVIATTLVTAGRLSSAEVGSFDYVFVDEAGHAVEPELMIAVDKLLNDKGKLVLAGDPEQLGPILRSAAANEYGLNISFLERLMRTRKVYQPLMDVYNYHVITKLLNSYRSHPAILEVPNQLFYDNELKVCADQFKREQFCQWEHLPRKNFPVIFHGVKGEDQREGNSPSFFNPQEASVVQDYIVKILQTRRNPVTPDQIGIISPYRQQVRKLQKLIKDGKMMKSFRGREGIKVGSVEEFQGQERSVIIISTVRSNSEHLLQDEHFKLGFLRNPKRFNVAITRAISLLIVIGNPEILCHDFYWKTFLGYCIDKGGYTGTPFQLPPDPPAQEGSDAIDDITKKFKSLGLISNSEDDVSEVQAQVDPPWRDAI